VGQKQWPLPEWRFSGNRALAALACAVFALGLPPGTAHADVMEVDSAGWRWVAGGTAAPVAPLPVAPAIAAPAAGQALAAVPAQWRGLVASLSARYDLSPAMIEAVIWQESRWRPNAVSPAGARGLAQLMPATARALGANPDVPEQNIEGGVRYLRSLVDSFGGDIERALAAYNAGPGRVIRAGGVPAIPETRAYVTSIFGRLAAAATPTPGR